ncbi:penicillin-binding protein 1C [Bradyrhizobium liaoningense]
MTGRVASALATAFTHLTSALLVGLLSAEVLARGVSLPDLSRVNQYSQTMTASSGELLWAFLTPDAKWRLRSSEDDIDPQYLKLLIAYEDRRFWDHRGVDAIALMRAGFQALTRRRSVSGASTITMQVVRMLEPKPRTVAAKIEQIFKAIRLERTKSKQEILRIYVGLAPFGGNIEGARAASLIYLGKEPRKLTLAESALLVALPQSPEVRRPDRYPDVARASRDHVLLVLADRGVLDVKTAKRADRTPLAVVMHSLAQHAPYLAMRLRSQAAEPIATLIDADLQKRVEVLTRHERERWSDGVGVAAIVIRNRDSSVAAYVGGTDVAANARGGFVDLVQTIRSPGSTLKPFVYAMAFEKLVVHPDTIVTDRSVEIAGYRPENADGLFAGDMSIRQALVRSRNTVAVMLLEKVGVEPFLARFRSAGRPLLLPRTDDKAGLAVVLGGVGLSLEQLTWFYTSLANDGKLSQIRLKQSDPVTPLGNLMSTGAARATADILCDVPPPPGYRRQLAEDGGRRIGFKTGTSYGFRDAWAVGFDEFHTVGVWVGRPDGAAHLGAYGATVAAPILMQIFDNLPVPPHEPSISASSLSPLAGLRELPPRLERLSPTNVAGATEPALEISFPRNGANVRSDRRADEVAQIPLVATGGKPPYRWTLQGQLQPVSPVATTTWAVQARGQLAVSVMDSTGSVATSSFWLN